MKRMQTSVLACLFTLALAASSAWAADNSTLPVSGGGTEVFANKDIAGVKFPKSIPFNSSGVELFTASNPGVVQGVGVAQGSTTAGQTGSLVMGAVSTSDPSYTNAQTSPFSATTDGKLRSRSSIDQTTFGTTNGVVSAANTYNTVAASQTAQALTGGSGGATGDYLSHCTALPTSTSPGVVTILDNAGAVYSFPGGASSASNLVPFAIPVGAKSTSGAWKVTTGANITVVCVGKFT